MKNTIKILGILAGVFLFLCSCKEDELVKYDQENNIYFPNQVYSYYATRTTMKWDDDRRYTAPTVSARKINEAQDTLEYSVSKGAVTLITVRLMGAISQERRQIACRAIPKDTSSVAKEGVNFEILDAFIPANSREGGILIQLNSEVMGDDDELTIEFELLPNEHFQTNFVQSPRKANSEEMVSTTHITLKYFKILGLPPNWNNWFSYILGPWSVKKIQIMVDQFDFDISDEFLYASTSRPGYPILMPYGMMLREYLEEQEALGNIIMDPVLNVKMRAGDLVYKL